MPKTMKKEMSEAMLSRFFNNEATPEEIDEMTAWMDEVPLERQKILDGAYRLHVLSIMRAKTSTAAAEHGKIRRMYRSKFVRYAAGVAASLVLGFGVNYLFFSQRESRMSELATKIEAPAGQHIRFTLNDGSVIDLNSGGSLTYPSVFTGGERRVKLSGEAMFDVAHDAKRPFIVETFSYEVKVLGTRFNVIADEDKNEFSTALFEGRVAINHISGNEKMMLEPDMMADLRGNRLISHRIGNRDEYLWPEGIISIGGMPFDELAERLGQAYNVRFVVDRPTMPVVRFTNLKIYRSDGIDHVMNILRQDSNFNYEYDAAERTVTIK